jgi:hypothetical protein
VSNEENKGTIDYLNLLSAPPPTRSFTYTLQCDGEFPCKRCKDDGLVCTAGTRKKMEYKQVPKGYVP